MSRKGNWLREKRARERAARAKDNLSTSKENQTASSASIDIYKLFDKEGTVALNKKLLSLSVSELKAIIKKERFDNANMTRSWKDEKRLSRFILERTRSSVIHGDAFRDTPLYLGNPKYDLV